MIIIATAEEWWMIGKIILAVAGIAAVVAGGVFLLATYPWLIPVLLVLLFLVKFGPALLVDFQRRDRYERWWGTRSIYLATFRELTGFRAYPHFPQGDATRYEVCQAPEPPVSAWNRFLYEVAPSPQIGEAAIRVTGAALYVTPAMLVAELGVSPEDARRMVASLAQDVEFVQ